MRNSGCPYCGQLHPAEAEFCPTTGKKLRAIPAKPAREQQVSVGTNPGGDRVLLYAAGIVALIAAVVYFTLHRVPPDVAATQSVGNVPKALTVASTPAPAASTPGSAQAEPSMSAAAGSQPPAPQATAREATAPTKLDTNPGDGAEIVWVPQGSFLMGSDPGKDPYFWGAESPEHKVQMDSFWIYRTEVTQAMYAKCVAAHACAAPQSNDAPVGQQYGNPRFADFPVNLVTWGNADGYCRWAGARLPTEAEWEKAARGTDGRLFPWGDDPSSDARASFWASSTSAVGSYLAGASPYGALDMAGNVLEWVNDFFQSDYYQISPPDNPTGPASGTRRVIRGGAYNQEEVAGLRTVARASLKPGDIYTSVGFRCALDAP